MRVNSKIGIVTRLLAGQLRNHLIAAKDKIFSSYSKASKTDSWTHDASYSVGDVDNSPPSGTEIKNEYLHSLICLHGMYRDNFTFQYKYV